MLTLLLFYILVLQSGYNELKDLLPASSSFIGCKTTNAAILFRAAEYVKSLESNIEKNEEELAKFQTQYSAMEMILHHYENFSMGTRPLLALQLQMVYHIFIDLIPVNAAPFLYDVC